MTQKNFLMLSMCLPIALFSLQVEADFSSLKTVENGDEADPNWATKDFTDRILSPKLEEKEVKGIVILGSEKDVQEFNAADVGCVEVAGDLNLPGSIGKLRRALNDFIGKPLTSDTILEIKKQLISYYRDEGRPIIDVSVPEQNISDGVLRLVVYEATLGEVRSIGNQYFSSKKLIDYVRLKTGEPIDANCLIQDLNWMNRNTFRQTDALFTPGQKEGTSDIELLTKDRKTWRVYVGTDNTGLEQIGEERWFAGINLGNFLNLDQLFTYQFTMGTSYHEFSAHTAQWVIPLPWRNILSFYGGYSTVHAKNLDIPFNPGFGTNGHSMQASMRWDVPLPPQVDFLHEFIWGADWKRTNNTLSFIGTEFFGKNANLFQIVVGYNLGYEDAKRKVSFTWENLFSPGQWLPDQSKATYSSLRAFAKPLYYYTRITSSAIFRHVKSGSSLNFILRGQWSTANLLSSEEYGIGGYDTVRGYDERQFNGDYAIVANVEARTPQWPFFLYKKNLDRIQFLAFFDYGKIWVHKQLIAEPKGIYIESIGAGLRYLIDQYVTVRLDYGYGLKKIAVGAHTKTHFSVIVSY